tara:strand:+ start:4899 stop:7319 length:2421 start_codon:yes stop_codon:yes gene_type:complete
MKSSDKLLFTSKANTLDFFNEKIKKSKIEKFYVFTVREWNDDRRNILNQIKNKFQSKIVIRSSAKGEDSKNQSQAGKFKSILNIEPTKKNVVGKAIREVIGSYNTKQNNDSFNQVLIQRQTLNSLTSGVIFTKTLRSGAPYYVINYEDGDTTDSVTKGMISNVIEIHNDTENKNIPKKWKKLISAIKEIESISKNQQLDIEFAITKKEIIIFQIRPLTSLNHINYNQISRYVKSEIKKNRTKFDRILENKKLKMMIFSNMTDWNPAEIIGERPKNLDYSLYDYLIMKKSWKEGRKILGYNDVKESLMENFSGRPYVNVHASFQSLIPKKINKEYQKKILEYYFKKLENSPELHDKVEFEILFTCYDFTIKERLLELIEHGFSKKDIRIIKDQLLEFTNDLIQDVPEILSLVNRSLKTLENKRKETKCSGLNYCQKLSHAHILLENCQKFGAIQFSSIARIAFIATILLKTISNVSKIKNDEIEQIINSISTPVTDFQNDLIKLKRENISKKEFLLKYGHLRPGTYDITIQRYDKMPEILHDLELLNLKKHSTILKKKSLKKIKAILLEHGLVFHNIDFFDFIIETISLREKAKFEFTKSLSDSIELIADAANELGFSRDELSYLSLNDILKFKKISKAKLQKFWKQKIDFNKNQFIMNEFVELPPIIFSKNEFNVIPYYIAKPNYITKQKIKSNILLIDEIKHASEINGKIILIDSADPGYDWIFGKNPSGLITKYGGAASHMAIRCAELNLPAAIGCGEILFNKLATSLRINLDCKHKDITILEFKEKNSFLEEKRILRSLGYIR